MICQTSDCPSVTREQFGALQVKYLRERDRQIQCDNDSLVDMPSKNVADGYEKSHNHQTNDGNFGFCDNALLHTRIESLKRGGKLNRWHVGPHRGDEIKARFVVLAMVPHNTSKRPGMLGIPRFKGKIFHTARRDCAFARL